MVRFLFLLLTFFSSLYANYADYYVGKFELLYMKPTLDHSHYVIDSENFFNGEHFPNGKRYINDPRFQLGFRIEGIYGFCDQQHELDFRFTYLAETHANSKGGNFLFDAIGYPGSGAQTPEDTVYSGIARYNQHFHYYALDGVFNRLTFCCCPENFTLFLGAHFAYIKVKETFSSDGTSDDSTAPIVMNRYNRHSWFWGLGPEFGFDYRYAFLKNLAVGTNARAALLASHICADLHYVSLRSGPTGVNLNNEPLWRVTPTWDVKIFLTYACPFRCLNIEYELGYELIWYHKSVDAITGYSAAFAGDTLDLYSNFNLQGPYIALSVGF